jgi:hypothetical protein
MKKIFLVIALVAMSLAVAPQVFSQDMAKVQQLSDEANRIEAAAKARGGTFTAQELQRLQQIQQEIMQAMGMAGQPVPNPQTVTPQQQPRQPQSQQPEQQQTQRQQPNNWPGNAILNKYGIGSITQPSGTLASFTERTDGRGRLQITLVNVTEDHSKNVIDQVKKITGIRGRGGAPIDSDSTDSRTWGSFSLSNWMIDVNYYESRDKRITIVVSDPRDSPDKG